MSAERLFYLSAGPFLALLVGMALVPFRGFTTASNFSFVFLALIIVVAELGGRWPAVATALTSALSLDFFLTQPYLRLAIDDKHDIIAFVGLAACGLVAAALGSERGRSRAALSAARARLALLHSATSELRAEGPLEPRLIAVLRSIGDAIPLAGAVVRDVRGYVEASRHDTDTARTIPEAVLQPTTLLPADHSAALGELPLPEEGGRIALVVGERQVGWLDVWGNGAPTSLEARRALSDVAQILAPLLATPSTTQSTAKSDYS